MLFGKNKATVVVNFEISDQRETLDELDKLLI